jgi:hypothetical protein
VGLMYYVGMYVVLHKIPDILDVSHNNSAKTVNESSNEIFAIAYDM